MRAKPASARAAVVHIVSQHEWTSRALESILSPTGYVVLKSYTRRQALERGLEDTDAIIIDAQLPDGDGFELCEAMRALVTPTTPILLTVPNPPTRRDRLAALRAGAWDCLTAPPDPEELHALLNTFVAVKLDADEARAEGLVDEATGLYNVRGLTRRARELAAHASRHRTGLGCVLLAPDPSPEEAEPVAEQPHGPLASRIAGTLKATARASDAIGRLGPSAFAVVAVNTDGARTRQLAERLASAITSADRPADGVTAFRMRAGWHGVPDFGAAAIDTVELMLCAAAALQKARADRTGSWLRGFDDGG